MAEATSEPEYDLFPVFCTADIPIDVRLPTSHVLVPKASVRASRQQLPASQRVPNRRPRAKPPPMDPHPLAQSTFDIPTVPPVEPFTSGFIGASFEDLVSFDEKHFLPGYDAQIDVSCFVVMDERTLEDHTVAFYALEFWERREEEEDPDMYEGLDGSVEVEGWKSIRLRIRSASALITWVHDRNISIVEGEVEITEDGIMDDSSVLREK
ncbi:hypothetical protein BU16DRAFT_562085 [Lophium mytilinum]|uniref:Uncharacterized protein n=1 Tax=Lophium mytilinum TaxID=390894 RepID=A0A6A6QU39_9PEZI|nr:hypothetical protein BU16DRAFT_562085 [Lophium mytilinum]